MCACHWTPDAVWKLSGVITRSVRRGRKHSQYWSWAQLFPSESPLPLLVQRCESELGPSTWVTRPRAAARSVGTAPLRWRRSQLWERAQDKKQIVTVDGQVGATVQSGGGDFVEFTKDKRFRLRLSDWSCDPARTVRIQSPFEVCHELGSLSHGDGWTLTWTLGLEGSLHEVNRRGTVRGTRNFKNKGCNKSQNNKWCPLVLVYILYFQSAKIFFFFFKFKVEYISKHETIKFKKILITPFYVTPSTRS